MNHRWKALMWTAAAGLIGSAASGGAGDAPETPLILALDRTPIQVTLSPSRPLVWFQIVGDPTGISHLTIETAGSSDTELYAYRNLEDARAGDFMDYDDDSGVGLNARIERFLGYSLPYLLSVSLTNRLNTGATAVSSTSSFEPPGQCPWTGPCPFVVAAKGKEGGRSLLAIMRGIRSLVLHGSPEGRELTSLYYRLSAELIDDAVFSADFREELFRLGSGLLPEMRHVLAIGLGESSDAVVSREAIDKVLELSDLLTDRLSPALSSRVSTLSGWLEGYAGVSMRQAMADFGLLPPEPKSLTLLAGEDYPVSRTAVVVKLEKTPTATPLLLGNRLATGLAEVDRVVAAYSIESAEPMFAGHELDERDPLGRVLKVQLPSDRVEEFVREMSEVEGVDYVERIAVAYLSSEDVYFPFQYGLRKIDAPEAWQRAGTSGEDVLVGVIDTGIDWRQADLLHRTRTDLGWNFVDDNGQSMDDHGHGTHIAGIVAGQMDNAYSVAGIAPRAWVVPYKALNGDGSGTWDDVAEAIVKAANDGVRINNLSLGGPESAVVEDALRYAASRGVLSIAAAGNDGQRGSSYPGSSPFTLSIGATDENNQLADFSNWGDLDLTAPGVDIASLFLDGLSCYGSGTSMATPHVVGVAALVASHNPRWRADSLEKALIKGAVDLGSPGYDSLYGFGLTNALRSLRARIPSLWHPFFAVDPRETPLIGDFDGDRRSDVITFTRDNPLAVGDVYVSLSNGAGFGHSSKWHDWFAIDSGEEVVIGDFDGDGDDDIGTWLGPSRRLGATFEVYVARSLGSGMAAPEKWLGRIGSSSADRLFAADVNNDRKDDLILFARSRGTVFVALSDGSRFGPPAVWHGFFAVSTYERPLVADVNGDGCADIVTLATDSPTARGDVYVAVSNCVSRFQSLDGAANNSTKWHDWFAVSPAELVRSGDHDGDGRDDFFTFLPQTGGQVYLVKSRGTSMGPNELYVDGGMAPSSTDRFLVGDANGDGRADIVHFEQSAGKVWVLLSP